MKVAMALVINAPVLMVTMIEFQGLCHIIGQSTDSQKHELLP
jgi:hypothetical protein